MSKVSKEITKVEVKEEFRVCQACAYGHGFHVSFVPRDDSDALQLILICPNCGARYDIGKEI